MEDMSKIMMKKTEDLKEEIKLLKEENTKTKRNLMWKVRKPVSYTHLTLPTKA